MSGSSPMGLRAGRLQWSDLGVAAMRFVNLLQGLQTPQNPTTEHWVIAMSPEERASDRTTSHALSPRN